MKYIFILGIFAWTWIVGEWVMHFYNLNMMLDVINAVMAGILIVLHMLRLAFEDDY